MFSVDNNTIGIAATKDGKLHCVLCHVGVTPERVPCLLRVQPKDAFEVLCVECFARIMSDSVNGMALRNAVDRWLD